MDKMLYVAMSGAKSAMLRQATNNNNLANISTTGFKEDLEASMEVNAAGRVMPTRVYTAVHPSGINGSSGDIMNTGRDLDIAIEGEGFIAIQNPDGSEAYTRAGNLKLNAAGLLETADGLPVMGNNGPITISPYESLQVDTDGTISIVASGDTTGTLVVLDRIKLVNPDVADLQRNENGTLGLEPRLEQTITLENVDGELRPVEQVNGQGVQPLPADGNVGVVSGALETSNVNPAKAMINMVELSRLFEMQLKLMKSAEENDAAINRILG
ncbi:MAG: flagellar basal body rod protein FlgF [Granulosicoccus sp.]|nr:flagellar basal body rod protein FlgF [Granulosicoccus sp.]